MQKGIWQMAGLGLLGCVVVNLPIAIWGRDLPAIFFTFVVALTVVVGFLSYRSAKSGLTSWQALTFLLTLALGSWVLLRTAYQTHDELRWIATRDHLKGEAKQHPESSGLWHQEWDGWGFPGVGDTVIYLVHDSKNVLADSLGKKDPVTSVVLPCEVVWVHRMESEWYMVKFYTETSWNDCEGATKKE